MVDRTDELLDDFENNVPNSRWALYGVFSTIVCALIWGVAYLHWKQYIDVIPIATSFTAYGCLLFLFLITFTMYYFVLKESRLLSLFIAIVVFCFLCVVLAAGVYYLGLDAGTLPFRQELLRLSFFSITYSSLSVLFAEIIYQYRIRRLQN